MKDKLNGFATSAESVNAGLKKNAGSVYGSITRIRSIIEALSSDKGIITELAGFVENAIDAGNTAVKAKHISAMIEIAEQAAWCGAWRN